MSHLDSAETALANVLARVLEIGNGRFFLLNTDRVDFNSAIYERTLSVRYSPEERNLRILLGPLPENLKHRLSGTYSAKNVRRGMAKASIDQDFFVLGEADKTAHLLQLSGFAFVDSFQSWTFADDFDVAENAIEFASEDGLLVTIVYEAKQTPHESALARHLGNRRRKATR
jgi:hypothetical protein